MGKLKNTFSWSHSAALDFDECRRRRYWNKYGKWGGWDRGASSIQKKAYQLDKMGNLYTILGQAVEDAAMHILRQHQLGNSCSPDEAYEEVARPYMNRAWKDSRDGRWKENPKRYACLHEHYYKTLTPEEERNLAAQLVSRAKCCLNNFRELTLPRIAEVNRDMELPVQVPGAGGDAEHFFCEDVKVYAIPDYAYRKDDAIHIHDWKAGRRKPEHLEQLALYGLWADSKHRRQGEDICVYVEYFKDGAIVADAVDGVDLERARTRIETSVAEMTEMLVDADRKKNEPLPIEDWDLALDADSCRRCNFLELCRDELRQMEMI